MSEATTPATSGPEQPDVGGVPDQPSLPSDAAPEPSSDIEMVGYSKSVADDSGLQHDVGSPEASANAAPSRESFTDDLPHESTEIRRYVTLAAEFLRGLHLRGRLMPLLREVSLDRMLMKRADESGLSVTEDELQAAADVFRRKHGLSSAWDTETWLKQERLTVPDFENALKYELLVDKLRDHLTSGQVAAHYDANRAQYERVRLRQIVVEAEARAAEIIADVGEKGRDFAELAREHSIDQDSTIRGGDLGYVFRHQMPAAIADAVFAAQPGDLVGPVPMPAAVHVFHVESVEPSELDEVTATFIRQELFNIWLAEQSREIPIDPDLLELL